MTWDTKQKIAYASMLAGMMIFGGLAVWAIWSVLG